MQAKTKRVWAPLAKKGGTGRGRMWAERMCEQMQGGEEQCRVCGEP